MEKNRGKQIIMEVILVLYDYTHTHADGIHSCSTDEGQALTLSADPVSNLQYDRGTPQDNHPAHGASRLTSVHPGCLCVCSLRY